MGGGKDTSRMISLGLLLVGLVLVHGGHHNHILSEHFIEKINSANSTWTAGRNFHPETSHNFLRTLMGVHPMAHKHLPPPKPTLLGGGIIAGEFRPSREVAGVSNNPGNPRPRRLWLLLGLWRCHRHVGPDLHPLCWGEARARVQREPALLLLLLRIRLQRRIPRRSMELLEPQGFGERRS